MKEKNILNLLNTASREELIALPGVGPALADRILAARPLASLVDAQMVKGISAGLLDKLSVAGVIVESVKKTAYEVPLTAHFSAVKENISDKLSAVGESAKSAAGSASEYLSEAAKDLSEKGTEIKQSVQALPERIKKTSEQRGPLWTTLVASGVTFFLSILFTLLLLGAINGSLKFATGSDFRALENQVGLLNSAASSLQTDVQSLQTRVDTLEGFGERTIALEKSQKQLQADLAASQKQLAEFQTQITTLETRVEEQQQRTQRFEDFLLSLQSLLNGIFPSVGGSQ